MGSVLELIAALGALVPAASVVLAGAAGTVLWRARTRTMRRTPVRVVMGAR